MLTGTIDPEEVPLGDPIDLDREVMCLLQEKYPEIIFGQLRCADEDYYCPSCPAGRVVSCAVVNCSDSMRRSARIEAGIDREEPPTAPKINTPKHGGKRKGR
jgi:hypothetical protein